MAAEVTLLRIDVGPHGPDGIGRACQPQSLKTSSSLAPMGWHLLNGTCMPGVFRRLLRRGRCRGLQLQAYFNCGWFRVDPSSGQGLGWLCPSQPVAQRVRPQVAPASPLDDGATPDPRPSLKSPTMAFKRTMAPCLARWPGNGVEDHGSRFSDLVLAQLSATVSNRVVCHIQPLEVGLSVRAQMRFRVICGGG